MLQYIIHQYVYYIVVIVQDLFIKYKSVLHRCFLLVLFRDFLENLSSSEEETDEKSLDAELSRVSICHDKIRLHYKFSVL